MASKRDINVYSLSITALLAVVCGACLLLGVIAAFQGYRQLRQELTYSNSASDSSAPSKRTSAPELKTEFDELKERIDNLQKLLTTLIALSSLYAVVLTVTGYINLQKITADAQTSLENAKKIEETLGKEYGSLTEISKNLERITDELQRQLPDVQELSACFVDLSDQDRQRLFFLEKAVAFAELVNSGKEAEVSELLSGAFITLSRFYRGLLLESEKKWDGATPKSTPVVVAETAYRNRALYYADQAFKHFPASFIACNELGNCFMEFGSGSRDEALRWYQLSLSRNRNQQKARFSISAIRHRRREYRQAELLLTEALQLECWQTEPVQARRNDLHYNRACAYTRLAEEEAANPTSHMGRVDALLKRAWEDLNLARVDRSDESRKTFQDDKLTGGDLAYLAQHPSYATDVAQLG